MVNDMSSRLVTECDVPVRNKPCGAPASLSVDVQVAKTDQSGAAKRYHGDTCEEHLAAVEKAFAQIGIEITSGRVDSKDRKAMRTKSGQAYTTAEARAWLLEQGIITNPTGRIGKANLNLYAEAH